MRTVLSALAFFTLAVLAPGQAFAKETLIVQVRSPLNTRTALAAVSTTVEGSDECGNHTLIKAISSRGRDFSRGARVAEFRDMRDGPVRLMVRALDRNNAVIVERPVRLEITGKNKVRVVTVLLSKEDCLGPERAAIAQCKMAEARCRSRSSKSSKSGKSSKWSKQSKQSNNASAACQKSARTCEMRAVAERAKCQRRQTPADSTQQRRGMWVVTTTGDDNLRGNRDNLNVVVGFRDGRKLVLPNVNKGREWKNGCQNYVHIPFSPPIRSRRDIASVTLETTFRGGIGGDNWTLNRAALLNEFGTESFVIRSGRPLFRFTGDRRVFTVRF